jgi:hypothetical protein
VPALVGAAYAMQNAPNPKRTLLTDCAVLAVPWAGSLQVASYGHPFPGGT